ncbi:probable LRR receptor-like serine/threonine-protein kinase At1g56130 [Camellia sinensis]|uniref:probable LRR receptor-like serine/threonine-protein kinase At1g56130 n=1 Tax=Camellia sinensis TaxID=4442 RepID=UPI0010363515|nr:probable LRR receptor-like serine/threonine-protein kinase At1g56130 [Camellia sinensis]
MTWEASEEEILASGGLDAVVFLRIVVFCYFGSSRVSGAIPSTFVVLRNLQTVWASDNELTSSIPEFIGNWSKLKSLRFQGNSFGGPIPTTFSNLTLMEDLRISDLSSGSSSLAFLKDMKSLNLL